MNIEDLVIKANNRWKSLDVWQPLLIAISIVMIVAIAHKVDWETTTTNPSEIWESRKITENENEESLSKKILVHEHKILPKALELLCSNRIFLEGRKVRIKAD